MRSTPDQRWLGLQVFLWRTCGLALAGLIILTGQVIAQQTELPQRVHSLKEQVRMLALRKEYDSAISLLETLIKLDQKQPFPPVRSLGIDLIEIASVLVPSGRYVHLEYLFKRGIQLLQSSGDAKLGDLMVAYNNLSAMYDSAGAYSARDQIISYIVNRAETLQQPIDRDTAEVFFSLADRYIKAAQYRPAAILYGRLQDYMATLYKNEPKSLEGWLKIYGDVLVGDRQFARAISQYERALTLNSNSTPADVLSIADLRLRIGSSAMQKGDFATAEQALDRARQELREAALDDTTAASVIYHNLAVVYLWQRRPEKYQEAERLLRRFLDIEASAGRAATVSFAQGLNELAVTLDLSGREEEAAEVYVEAITAFERLGVAPLDFADSLSDFAAHLMRQQKPAKAATHLQHALALREADPSQSPQEIANTVSDLATANFKAGNLEEASRGYWRAITMRASNTTSSQ